MSDDESRTGEDLESLDGVDRDLARLVVAGESNRSIARTLHLAEGTVKWRLHRLYRRVGAANRTQFALRVLPLLGSGDP